MLSCITLFVHSHTYTRIHTQTHTHTHSLLHSTNYDYIIEVMYFFIPSIDYSFKGFNNLFSELFSISLSKFISLKNSPFLQGICPSTTHHLVVLSHDFLVRILSSYKLQFVCSKFAACRCQLCCAPDTLTAHTLSPACTPLPSLRLLIMLLCFPSESKVKCCRFCISPWARYTHSHTQTHTFFELQ